MSIDRSKLTDRDWSTLWRAWTLRKQFDAGIGVYSGGEAMHVRRLERLGVLEYEGHGRDIDGIRDGEGPVYKLTADAIDLLTSEIRGTRDRLVIALSELLSANGGTCSGRILSARQLRSEEVDAILSPNQVSSMCEDLISCWKSMPFDDRRWGRWEYLAGSTIHAAKPTSKRRRSRS